MTMPKYQPIRKLNIYLGHPTCKTGQPNSFGYESKGSLEAHTEARTAC